MLFDSMVALSDVMDFESKELDCRETAVLKCKKVGELHAGRRLKAERRELYLWEGETGGGARAESITY